MLELEALGLDRVKTEVSVQHVDHNTIRKDFKNPDDHLFLRSARQRFGLLNGRRSRRIIQASAKNWRRSTSVEASIQCLRSRSPINSWRMTRSANMPAMNSGFPKS
jgi:hypothetical protein